MSNEQTTPGLSEAERIRVEAFGFDAAPTFAESMDRIAIRAQNISKLASEFVASVAS